MRGEGGVAGEGRIFDVAKFHSWGKCTMPFNVYIMWVLSFTSWVVNFMPHSEFKQRCNNYCIKNPEKFSIGRFVV